MHFLTIYSLAAIAGFALIVWGYGLARQEPVVIYVPPVWLRHLVLLLMVPVFPLFLAAYLPGRIQSATKHPMLAAVKLWAFAHLLANGSLAGGKAMTGVRLNYSAWYLQLDLQNYFMRIDKDVLFRLLAARLKDETALWLARLLVYHDCTEDHLFRGRGDLIEKIPRHKTLFHGEPNKGLPIGNLNS